MLEPTEGERSALQVLQLLSLLRAQVDDALAAWGRGERAAPAELLDLRDRLLRLDGALGQLEAALGEGG